MEWVKLHLDWANGLEALTDDDGTMDEAAAGRWILALLQYVRTGEKPKLYGPEKVLFAMAVADLKKDYAFLEKQAEEAEAKRQAVSEARREAANARWNRTEMQADANACTSMQQQSKPEQDEQNAPIRSKNKEQDIKNKDIERDKEKNNKKRNRENAGAKASRSGDITEARYDQRPNDEPDGDAIPRWLQDYQSEITGYSDPAGNPDAPDRPDIHGEE